MHTQSQFAELKYSKKIWAVGSIHSHFDSFNSIKEHILKHFVYGDKLIFLGNIIGFGKYSTKTLSSAINMRNYLLSKFLLKAQDIVFLRGAQEEMFLKLLQLQTAPNPQDIVQWMFEHGVDKTADSYGFNKEENLKSYKVYCNKISTINANLRRIGKEMDLSFNLTTMSARYTFVNLAKLNEVPFLYLQELIGHKNNSTTDIYLDVFPQKKMDDYHREVIDKVLNKQYYV